MSAKSLFEPIMDSYRTVKKSFAWAEKFVERADEKGLIKFGFSEIKGYQAKSKIHESLQTYEELTVVALWSVFERYLIEKTQLLIRRFVLPSGAQCDDRHPRRFVHRLQETQALKMEYWKFDEVLDCYKDLVGANEIGNAKQIKKYRDWVVHKNPHKRSPAKTDPASASRLLENIVSRIEDMALGEE